MILFNGTALETQVPVMVEDVQVSPIQLSPQARQRPIRFGADFVRMGGGTRTITITFALLNDRRDQRQTLLRQVARWARSQEEGRLQLPGYPDVYLQCICTELPSASIRQWWDAKMRLVFTCYDNPYYTDLAEKSAVCGSAFNVVGDAQDGPLMRIERTLSAQANNQIYSNGSETMTFSQIPAGNLVIDLNRQLATVNGQSIMQYYAFGSSFILPREGLQTITGTGSIKWRERWE